MLEGVIIRRSFIVEGGDKKYVDVYCEEGYVELVVLGVEPIIRNPRRFSRVYDRIITRVVTTRSKPLDHRRIRVWSINISGLKRFNDKTFIILTVNDSLNIYVPYGKARFVKDCIREVRGL